MRKFFKNIILLIIFAIVIGEVIVRFTHAVADIPQRTIDKYGIQKYIPNQDGYWKGGKHKWKINKLGWPGELPKSYDQLIMVIGDSFIENFMNPNDCHQSSFLKKDLKGYNFMEAGRSGVSLIEAMEISKQMDSLNPVKSLIYLNDNDFLESVSEIKNLSDITQLSVKNNTLEYGEMKAQGIKKVLYNWKLLYYFYNRFPISNIKNKKDKTKDSIIISKKEFQYKTEISQLMEYIINNYEIENKTLIFQPNSNESIIQNCIKAGFDIIVLNSSNDKPWTFDYDSHWSCYGHERAALQISKQIFKKNN